MAVTCRPTTLRRFAGLIGAIVFGALTIYFIYDGWINPAFQEGEQKQWQLFNQIGAFILPIGIVISILWGAKAARQSIVLDEEGLSVNEAESIPLKTIIEIDDSTFEDDRYLRVKYRGPSGTEETVILDAQKFDGVEDVLDELLEVTGLPSKAAQVEDAGGDKPIPTAKPAEKAKADAEEDQGGKNDA